MTVMLQFLKMGSGIQISSSLSLPSLSLANILSLKLLFSWGEKCPNSATLNTALLLGTKSQPTKNGLCRPMSVSLPLSHPVWLSLLTKAFLTSISPSLPAHPGHLESQIFMAQALCGWKIDHNNATIKSSWKFRSTLEILYFYCWGNQHLMKWSDLSYIWLCLQLWILNFIRKLVFAFIWCLFYSSFILPGSCWNAVLHKTGINKFFVIREKML